MKGQCPRPLDDGDMLDERYSTIKNCYLYKICLFVLEFFVCTRISCVLIYLKNSKIIAILEASFQMLLRNLFLSIRTAYAILLCTSFEKKFDEDATPENFIRKYTDASNDSVSYETVRKWLKGINTPNFVRMCSIAIWLDMDVNAFLDQHREFNFL